MTRTGALLLLLAATLSVAAAESMISTLQPFTSINVCSPYNIVVGPSTAGKYQIMVDADTGVAESINATVRNSVLSLSINNKAPTALSFNAPNPIGVSVMLPADRLAAVAISSVPAITVAIAPGFSVPNFTATLSGTSTLSAMNLKAGEAQIINAGTGNVYVAGTITSAAVSSSGTGSTYLVGVTSSAVVDASGISKVFISGTPATQITGQVSGISNVYYDQGECSIGSQFGGIFGSPCTQQAIQIPATLTEPQWSCAVKVFGTFGCSNSGTTSTSTTGSGLNGGFASTLGSNNLGSTTSSSSSSSGGGTGSTFSSQTINGVTTTTQGSSSSDGSSQLVTNTGTITLGTCPVTGAALDMLPTS